MAFHSGCVKSRKKRTANSSIPPSVPTTMPATWPGDRAMFVDVDDSRGASVGTEAAAVLSLVTRAIVVNVTVAVCEITIVVRLV